MIKSVKSKLEEILNMDVNNGKQILTEKELSVFEGKYGLSLPDDYKAFLTSFYSCYVREGYYYPMKERSSLTPENGMEVIDYFYNTEFISNVDNFISLWGNSVLPIGRAAGDYICIGVQEKNYSKIYHLYHEALNENETICLIADSFDEFILSFKKINDSSKYDSKKIKLKLSPELLESLKKLHKNEN